MGFLDLFTKAVGKKIEEKIVDLAEKKEEQRKQNEDSQKKLGGERELDLGRHADRPCAVCGTHPLLGQGGARDRCRVRRRTGGDCV